MKIRKNKKGFTIVELVIVIGVIGILSAILIPTFVNVTKNAEDARTRSNLANAYSAYAAEAADGYVDGVEPQLPIEFAAQEKVALNKGSDYYTYGSNGWNITPTTTKPTGAKLVVTEADADEDDIKYSTYGGYVFYFVA